MVPELSGFENRKCSTTEKILMVLTSFCMAFIIYLLVSQYRIRTPIGEFLQYENLSSAEDHEKICMTEKCIRSAAHISKMIDKTIDPCDNFYKFVCGNFIKNTVLPEDKTVINTFSLVNDKVKLQLKTLLDPPLLPEDPTPLKLLKTVYKSCMNTTKIENESLLFVKKVFKELGGWPVMEANWNEKKFDWKQLLYRLRRSGWKLNMFVKMQIDPGMKNSSKGILTITQPSVSSYLAMTKRVNDKETQAYYEYMVKMAGLFGAPPLSASVEMMEVLHFEMNLSKIVVASNGKRNLSLEHNLMTIKELQESIHTIPWLQLINNFLAPKEMLTSKDTINVALPKFLKNLEDLLLNTNKRIIANYMFWKIVRNFVTHFPERFRKQELEYLKIIKGVTWAEPRWVQCIKEVHKLNVAASSVYIKNFFTNRDKKKVSEIAAYIKESLIETLEQTDWMDPETKERALVKAKKMGALIGYPEELLDDDRVEEYHKELELNPNDHFLKINLNICSFLHQKRVKKLRVKSDWTSQSFSYDVNGFYNQRANAIELMAAMLQENFFDSRRPQYMNFGSIGEVIGHEMTHGFDGEGKQFDENGTLVNWWAPKTRQTFSKKAECLVRQYSNLTVAEIGLNLNGFHTLDENIADNGGFKMAYRAYLKWVEKNKEEELLPGIAFTQRQIFWISAAMDGCAKYTKEALRRFVIGGRHAPENFRIMVPFMNLADFAKDFNCSKGSKMNPEEKCQVW